MATALLLQPGNLAAQIQELINHLPNLPSGKLGFATSLINQFSRKGELSEKQIPYVAELVALATGKPSPVTQANVGDLSGLIGLFKTAGAKLKWPKITLVISGKVVILSMAGERSQHPGSINIKGPGPFGDSPWYGRVSPTGQYDPSRSVTPELQAALVALLTGLSTDPFATVQKYGKLTGNCMFCAAKLEDERSLKTGCGPTCAEKWGLLAQWKQAAK